jgi:hypothetical protein
VTLGAGTIDISDLRDQHTLLLPTVTMNPQLIPPLPSIDDVELLLEVHTHRDLKPPSHRDSQWDSERLADLGAKALDAVITYHFFEQRPFLAAEEIAVCFVAFNSHLPRHDFFPQMKRELNTSPTMLNTWLNLYELKRRLRVPPNQSDAIFADLEVSCLTFSDAVVGPHPMIDVGNEELLPHIRWCYMCHQRIGSSPKLDFKAHRSNFEPRTFSSIPTVNARWDRVSNPR